MTKLAIKKHRGSYISCVVFSDRRTFYGFMLYFSATSTGTIYHYVFGWEAPHDYFSLPVMFGTVGGVLLCVGTAGQYLMKLKTEPSISSPDLWGMEAGFIALFFY